MLADSRKRILQELGPDDLVLDVGGWGRPFSRASWVIDLAPYETRGLYGDPDPEPERFSAETWVVRDICDHEPWPFEDDQFDFAICSHTLEDIRDPIWVCSELNRVATAGYIEVPARSEEQTRGVHGPWVGWSHHHWLVDIENGGIEFVFKPHFLHGHPEFWVESEWHASRSQPDRVSELWWQDSFAFRERIFFDLPELHAYLEDVYDRYGAPPAKTSEASGRGLRNRARRLLKP